MVEASKIHLIQPFMFAGGTRTTISRENAVKLQVDFEQKIVRAIPRGAPMASEFVIPFANVAFFVLATEGELLAEAEIADAKRTADIEARAQVLAKEIADREALEKAHAQIAAQAEPVESDEIVLTAKDVPATKGRKLFED